MTHNKLKRLLSYNRKTGAFRWRELPRCHTSKVAGWINANGYRHIEIAGKTYKASRLAVFYVTGRWPTHFVDHKNLIRDDDRWVNLRECNRRENNANTSRKGKYPRGVTQRPQQISFGATAVVRGKSKYLGSFPTIETAAAAVQAARVVEYGDFAK